LDGGKGVGVLPSDSFPCPNMQQLGGVGKATFPFPKNPKATPLTPKGRQLGGG